MIDFAIKFVGFEFDLIVAAVVVVVVVVAVVAVVLLPDLMVLLI